ncbi:MAG: prephenate dehydratase [Micrococcales bacterium]|nr:prephenate dehydratase [Micrococcales bacterium]
MTTYAYLGPAGTFTQMALTAFDPAAEEVPLASVDAALAAVRRGHVDRAMVPIENSVEGGVSATLDALASGDPLVVVGEVLVPVTFVLAAREGMPLSQISSVGTHSHAWAQVRGWVGRELPGAAYVATLSTAEAAESLARNSASYDAAVCAPLAAEVHGLQVLAEDIRDNDAAVTRFVAVSLPGALPEPTGADKTTLVLYQRSDRAGGLLELLEQFAARGINMARLESRPTKSSMGDYCFSIDIEGHVMDERVGEALMGLHRISGGITFLGSYPRADKGRAQIADAADNASFREAREWLRSLRHLS